MDRNNRNNISKELQDCINSRSASGYFWRQKYCILGLLLLCVLMWLLLVYGAMLGAALCGGRVRYKSCANCHGTNFMQSVAWTKNAISIY